MRVRIYKNGPSEGAAALKEGLIAAGINARLLKTEGSGYKYKEGDVIINWGASLCPYPVYYNSPSSVIVASDKHATFSTLSHLPISLPDYTNMLSVAAEMIQEGSMVVCRTLLRASGGRGIVVASTEEELVPAPLYTRYIKKRNEYRVHVFGDDVIDVQKKARSREVADENVNWQIRSHANGFIFMREGVDIPDKVKRDCIAAVTTLGLSFGAVDVVHNETKDLYYILEVNTAPGLEGSTVEKYASAITNDLKQRKARIDKEDSGDDE